MTLSIAIGVLVVGLAAWWLLLAKRKRRPKQAAVLKIVESAVRNAQKHGHVTSSEGPCPLMEGATLKITLVPRAAIERAVCYAERYETDRAKLGKLVEQVLGVTIPSDHPALTSEDGR